AIDYARLAGKRALARFAYDEGVVHLRAALELLPQLSSERPLDELEIQLALGQALVATRGRGLPETGLAYSRARELCEATNAPLTTKFEAVQGEFLVLFERNEMGTMQRESEELLALAGATGNPALIALAHWRVGWTLVFDDPVRARSYL